MRGRNAPLWVLFSTSSAKLQLAFFDTEGHLAQKPGKALLDGASAERNRLSPTTP